MNIGDLVKFVYPPGLKHNRVRGSIIGVIIGLPKTNQFGGRQDIFKVAWTSGRTTTEWRSYLEKIA